MATRRQKRPLKRSKNYNDCITDLVTSDHISAKKAEEMRGQIERHALNFGGLRSDEAAAMKAADEFMRKAEVAKYQAQLQAVVIDKAVKEAQAHPRGAAVGAMAHLVRDLTGNARGSNVEYRAKALLGMFHADFAEAMSAMRTRNLGFTQDKQLVLDVVAELHGKKTGNGDAAKFATAFSKIAERARQMFNKAGGDIKKRADWGMVQTHDRRAVAAVDRATWVEYTRQRVDPTKMFDDFGNVIGPEKIREFLESAYDEIVAGTAGVDNGAKALKNKHTDPRSIKFLDADAWIEYQQRFGEQDLFAAMTSHMDMMAGEIAQMQILGPNPQAGYAALRTAAQESGAGEFRLGQMDNVFDVLTGKVNHPGSVRGSEIMGAIRHSLVASKLGAAALSAITDFAFLRQSTAWLGMPAVRVLSRYLKTLNPANEADRIFATKLGLVADAWTTRALATNRFTEELTGPGVWSKMSEAVIRASGLSAHTDAGRKALGMEIMAFLAENLRAGKFNQKFANVLEGYGFTGRDIADLQAIPTVGRDGTEFVSIENIRNSDLPADRKVELTTKVLELVDTELDFGVPMPDARVRGHLLQGQKPGTILGEFVRGTAMFRSFPMGIMYSHIARGLYQGDPAKRGAYLASLMISTTILGAVAYQAKNIAKGREPFDMEDPGFWGAAFMQGGGAGIMGDFLVAGASGKNRYGNSFLATLAGPLWGGALEDATKATLGNLGLVAAGSAPSFRVDAVGIASRYAPGSSLWYARAAFDRLIWNQMQLVADPAGARRKFRSQEQYLRETHNAGFLWRPGQLAPEVFR